MSAFPVVLDACVLAPYPLADLLLRLADEQTYRPLWSEDILGETRRTMLEDLRLSAEKVDKRLSMMREAFIDAEVTGYQNLIPVMTNNTKDRHVLAAAVRERAAVIVTFDRRGFPEEALKGYNIRALHPDEFLLDQIELYKEETRRAIQGMVDSYVNPTFTVQQILLALDRRGVPRFAERAQRLFPDNLIRTDNATDGVSDLLGKLEEAVKKRRSEGS
jgi:predicted nucleic acid-binding protein